MLAGDEEVGTRSLSSGRVPTGHVLSDALDRWSDTAHGHIGHRSPPPTAGRCDQPRRGLIMRWPSTNATGSVGSRCRPVTGASHGSPSPDRHATGNGGATPGANDEGSSAPQSAVEPPVPSQVRAPVRSLSRPRIALCVAPHVARSLRCRLSRPLSSRCRSRAARRGRARFVRPFTRLPLRRSAMHPRFRPRCQLVLACSCRFGERPGPPSAGFGPDGFRHLAAPRNRADRPPPRRRLPVPRRCERRQPPR